MKVLVVIVATIFVILALQTAYASQYIDTFDGTAIDTAKWQINAANGISVYQRDALLITGTSTDPTPNWIADGHITTNYSVAAEGLCTSVDMTVTGTGGGFWGGMYWGQDTGNWIHIFVGKDGDQAVHIGYAYAVNGGPLYGQWLRDQVGSRYTMSYSCGLLSFFADGEKIGQQEITLSTVQVALGVNVLTSGDSVAASFDNFALSSPEVPEPASIWTVLLGIIGAGKIVLSTSRKRD